MMRKARTKMLRGETLFRPGDVIWTESSLSSLSCEFRDHGEGRTS